MSKVTSVIVKMQRPLYTNSSYDEVLSYIVDDDLEQISNEVITEMDKETIGELFESYYKVYYLGSHIDGEMVTLAYPLIPMYKEEWC